MLRNSYFCGLVDDVAAATGWRHSVCAGLLVLLGGTGFLVGWHYLAFGHWLIAQMPFLQQLALLLLGR